MPFFFLRNVYKFYITSASKRAALCTMRAIYFTLMALLKKKKKNGIYISRFFLNLFTVFKEQ